jgi:hypothetical protein
MVLADLDTTGLQGVTLKVYLYIVKKGEPVGPRDVMRNVGLSSPSVAYRHIQKLENMGLLTKNEFGNYVAKEKVGLRGYVWVGRTLLSHPLIFALIFLGVFCVELVVFVLHVSVETEQFKIFFLLLTITTVAALILFVFEGIKAQRKVGTRYRDETNAKM